MTEIAEQNDSKGRLWLILLIGIAIGVIGTMLFTGPSTATVDSTGTDSTSTGTSTLDGSASSTSLSGDENKNSAALIKVAPKSDVADAVMPATKMVTSGILRVEDQTAGSEVKIASVTHEGVVWVAVRELKDGEPWNVLGARRLDAGMSDTIVYLLRNTEAGNTYLVTMYKDNGDGVFDKHSDTEITNDAGALIAIKFKAL